MDMVDLGGDVCGLQQVRGGLCARWIALRARPVDDVKHGFINEAPSSGSRAFSADIYRPCFPGHSENGKPSLPRQGPDHAAGSGDCPAISA
jgi:hypothetical protein